MALGLPAQVSASHHKVRISEVFAGAIGDENVEFVELQMLANGENRFSEFSAVLDIYNGLGLSTTVGPLASNPQSGNQRTVLFTTSEAATAFDVVGDYSIPTSGLIDPASGAVCFRSSAFSDIDCVSWGMFAGTLTSPAGEPASPISAGQSLTRSIADGCPTLHEELDDTDNSVSDFFLATPTPRPSSAEPTEVPCVAPKFTIKGPNKTRNRRPKFRFTPSEPVSDVRCKVDSGPFEPCSSPFRTKRLKPGKHTFRVRGTDQDGMTGTSQKKFKVTKKKKKQKKKKK